MSEEHEGHLNWKQQLRMKYVAMTGF